MKTIIRFCLYYKRYMWLFIADISAALCVSLCDLFYPFFTRKMLGEYITENNIRMLLILGAVLVAVYILKYFLNYFVTYYGHIIGVKMQADMRKDMFSHLLSLPVAFFDDNKTGFLMSRMISDLFDISELAHHGPEDLFISGVMLVGSFICMANIYLPLALIVFSSLPIMLAFAASNRLKMSVASKKSKTEIAELNATVENSISGVRVVKSFNSSESEKKKFDKGNSLFISARKDFIRAMAKFNSGTTFITDILQIVMYVAGGLFCLTEKINVVDFTAFVLYISMFTTPIKKLISFVEQYQNGMTGFEHFCEIMDTKPESDEEGAIDAGLLEGNIEFSDVGFSYPNGKKVLSHFNLKLQKGKTLALVGPSGGGKTTLCNLIPRIYECSEGAIFIDGRDIRSFTRESLRRNIAVVSQDVFLFNASIRDNIAFGDPSSSDEDIIKAAKLADIHDFVMSLDKGYDTNVGERGVKLSGGQRQRISIARAFLKNPPILILDEATSALDNVSECAIRSSLGKLACGRTVIVVAHRLSTVRSADEIVVITDEGVVEKGSHAQLLTNGGIYAELWNLTVSDR